MEKDDSISHVSLYSADSPHRKKLRESASKEGAEDQVREPGISDVESEPELPRVNDGVDYSIIPRPQEEVNHGTIFPAGKPLGRGRDTGEQENDSQMGTIEGVLTVASVSDVKAAIDAANHTANEVQGMVRAAIDKLSEAAQQYAVALDGSGNETVNQARNAVEHATEQFEMGIQAIAAAIESASQYGAGL